MGIVQTLKGTLESKNGQMLMNCVLIAMGLYSSISMLLALFALEANSDDISNSFDNWRLKPLVSVAFVTSQASSSLETAECPTDHPENLNDVVFGGVSAGLCTCKSGAVWRDDGRNYFQYSSSGTCNTNQTKADCKSDSSIPAMTLPFWSNGLMVCGRRGGEAAIIGTAPFRERPVPKTTGTPCPTGYRLCGDASEAGEAICFPTSEPLCPISALATVPSSSFRPSDYRNATFFQQADGSWLVASREAGHLPVVNAKAGFRSVCVGQDDPYTYGTSSANVAGRLTVSFGCKGGREVDDRYMTYSTLSQPNLLQYNFNASSNYCSSTGRSTVALANIGGPCSNSDSQCSAIKSRTVCEKLMSYTVGDSSAGSAELFFRREIKWAPSCPVPRKTLVENVDPLMEIVSFTQVVTGINIATNVIGILIYINLFINVCSGDSPCCPMSHEAEKALLKRGKTWVDTIMKLARIIPLGLLATKTFEVSEFWSGIAGVGCTDPTTQATLVFLSSKLATAYASYSVTLAIDCVSLLLSLYHVSKALCCPAADIDSEGTEEEQAAITDPKPDRPLTDEEGIAAAQRGS
ncbi:hypothetical protein FNF29_00066 [Cafeteria roenbergensis]|uniref:Uncharacterized protein n=1 Tax=Cafeteria roenbergensis TaxID=33653 RepID=A0A5A8CZB2_CAFRO|nr:hypothetical protein FNF29_00066 [Cafeteria roenbergensis]|eukprot:KAA0157490.1 hypothetical protein FNF29_00066 [Cafeteria roenbergensis]